jgi:hypothetical protein
MLFYIFLIYFSCFSTTIFYKYKIFYRLLHLTNADVNYFKITLQIFPLFFAYSLLYCFSFIWKSLTVKDFHEDLIYLLLERAEKEIEDDDLL